MNENDKKAEPMGLCGHESCDCRGYCQKLQANPAEPVGRFIKGDMNRAFELYPAGKNLPNGTELYTHPAQPVQPAGAQGETVPLDDATKHQAEAWLQVCELLNEVSPNWQRKGKRGVDAALQAVRELKVPAVAVNEQMLESVDREKQHIHTMNQFKECCRGTNCTSTKARPIHSQECMREHDSLHALQSADEVQPQVAAAFEKCLEWLNTWADEIPEVKALNSAIAAAEKIKEQSK